MTATCVSPFVYEAHQQVAVPRCPLCQRANESVPAVDRYGFPVGTSMCACGFAYLNPQLSADGYLEFYDTGYRQLSDPLYRPNGQPKHVVEAHDVLMRGVMIAHASAQLWPVRPVSVLDVGGGTGALLATLATVWPLTSVTVLDPNPGELARAAGRGYRTLHGLADSRPAVPSQDVIVCAQTLDHLQDPVAVLTWMRDMLAPGGWAFMDIVDAPVLAHMTHVSNGYAWKLDHPCYWRPTNLLAALQLTGWRIKARARYGYHYAVWCEGAIA